MVRIMSQFKNPLHLPPFDYEDNYTMYDADTAKTLAASRSINKEIKEKKKDRIKFTLSDFAMIIFIVMTGLMCIYTFFIICVELFKIFTQIVLR